MFVENPNREIDLEAINDNGFTALALAVKNKHLDIVNYLIAKGANVNSLNKVIYLIMINRLNNQYSLMLVTIIIEKEYKF